MTRSARRRSAIRRGPIQVAPQSAPQTSRFAAHGRPGATEPAVACKWGLRPENRPVAYRLPHVANAGQRIVAFRRMKYSDWSSTGLWERNFRWIRPLNRLIR